MSTRRFEHLARAFGGDVERWPLGEHEAARRLVSAHPARAGEVLDAAGRLDALLNAAPSVQASQDLRERILMAAPAPRLARSRSPRRGAGSVTSRWLATLGLAASLAGAAVAGVAAGIVFEPTASALRGTGLASDSVEEAALLLREPVDLGEG